MAEKNAQQIVAYLRSLGNAEIAEHSQRFFKTGEGEYGYGDQFLGIRVPVIRKAVRQYRDTRLDTAEELRHSEFHEVRLFALILLVSIYSSADEDEKDQVFQCYLNNSRYINNWDLVDTSAPHIVGVHLAERDRTLLYELVESDSLWERRIAVLATFHFIRNGEFEDALRLCELLLNDREDLIHKASGWMLREIGKRDKEVEIAFLDRHCGSMPRTMLRYAIEKFSKDERRYYMSLM